MSVVIRSSVSGSPVDTVIDQSDWNMDSLDGSYGDGNLYRILFDPSKSCIFYIAFEWLGVGTVQFGIVANGKMIPVHNAHHSQISTSVYMSTPNLPVRYEISNDGSGAASSMEQICSTVISEGGFSNSGVVRSVDRAGTGLAIGTGVNAPILSIRLKSTHIGATAIPLSISTLNATTGSFRWQLILNPTIGGVDAASWQAVANSCAEYDVARTASNTVSGGTLLASGYASGDINTASKEIESAITLGSTIAGVRDEIVLAIHNLSVQSETYYDSIIFRELL